MSGCPIRATPSGGCGSAASPPALPRIRTAAVTAPTTAKPQPGDDCSTEALHEERLGFAWVLMRRLLAPRGRSAVGARHRPRLRLRAATAARRLDPPSRFGAGREDGRNGPRARQAAVAES